MRIGELAERTGTSRRLLRYNEEQELIAPDRSANGYLDHDERLVDRVLQIKGCSRPAFQPG
jgi:DNA-binding transcriptional MerR regulator